MSFFHAIIFGMVEGVSEFLPISSTGHLILTAKLLGLKQSDFMTSFEIAIQLGAILSVIVLYGRRLLCCWKVFSRVAAAFIPTAVLGLVLYKIIKKFLAHGEPVVLASLFLGGVFLILFEKFHREKENSVGDLESITYGQALLIGVFQSIAMIPGVSRAAATICGGLILGLKRKTIVEFSFLLAVPTMLAATGLDLLKNGAAFSGAQWQVLGVGFLVSFFVAILSIQWLLRLIRTHTFSGFGIYRILAAAAFFFFK